MDKERRSKHNEERKQRCLRLRQEYQMAAKAASASTAPVSASSSDSSSSHPSSDPYTHTQPVETEDVSLCDSVEGAAPPPWHQFTGNNDYLSEESDPASGQSTPRATQCTAATALRFTGRGMFNRYEHLQKRRIENTRHLNLDVLRRFGVYDSFCLLTERIGFTPAFWNINCTCYDELTIEFLSSLKLRYEVDLQQPYIKFRMHNVTLRVTVAQLREWFGFAPNPTTKSLTFRVGYDKDHFWRMLTGMEQAHSNQFRSLAIPHPTLRCLHRAIASTIFARGETVSRANEEDLQLLDHMLRRDVELERPDLMLCMVHHWLHIQQNKKVGGSIHIGAYVTFIAEKLGITTFGLTPSKGPIDIDAKAFESAKFIKIARGPANHSDHYYWKLPNGTQFLLPVQAPLSFEDESSWLFPPPVPAAGAPFSIHSPLHTPDVDMPDAARTHPDEPSSSHPPPSFTAPPRNPTLHDVYSLMTALRGTQLEMQASMTSQGASLTDIRTDLSAQNTRIAQIETHISAWQYFAIHGHWPDPPPPHP